MEYLLTMTRANHACIRNTDHAGRLGVNVGALAYFSLIKEVELTPKPGLVDCHNNGSHRDMNLRTFYTSAKAIAKWFPIFFMCGFYNCTSKAEEFIHLLRAEGIKCENDMFAATSGVNTHKGGIFSLGLLCAAAGRLYGRHMRIASSTLCNEVANMCAHLVCEELNHCTGRTAGEILFHKHGLTGARGEAASGFSSVRRHSLPEFKKHIYNGATESTALHAALLRLLAHNDDTNVVSRGGIEGLRFVQENAIRIIDSGGVHRCDYIEQMHEFDSAMIERNISPGGSADLLAVTWFLSNFPD